jgi:cell division protein FtsW (lipid II flippase)
VVFLAPLALIDMGLFLVMLVPIGFATLLAVGHGIGARHLAIPVVAFALLFALLSRQVLFRSVDAIRDADSHAAKAAAFDGMTRLLGARLGPIAGPMDRVAARTVAKADRKLAEELLLAAKPGPARDLLIPSIEQIWGAEAYARAGALGVGLGQAVVGGRGVAEPVSYAENTFSVFVLAEHGAVGGLLVLTLYLLLIGAVGVMALGGAAETPASYRASRALFLVAALIVAIPASYVALSNLGIVPITGQNMPFLGLNAWSDVAICAGVIGILITGAIRGVEEMAR